MPLLNVFNGRQQVAIAGGLFILLRGGGLRHALAQTFHQIVAAPFEKRTRVAGGFGVNLIGGKPGYARPQAPLNVVLQAGARMGPPEVHRAGRHAKGFVNEVHNAIRQASGEKRPEIDGPILAKPPRDVNARVFLEGRETDIRVGLVVPQKHIELGLILLDQIILKRQCLAFIVDHDVIEIGNFAHQRACFRIRLIGLEKIRPHPRPQRSCFPDIENFPERVLEQVHPGFAGEGGDFFG